MTTERFEDRLLAELRRTVAARSAPAVSSSTRPHRTRRYALSGVGVAAATAAIAVLAISSDATPSAYAVQSAPDGSVTVSINRLSDAAGLQQTLRAAGVPAVVAYDAPGAATCMTIAPGDGDGPQPATVVPAAAPTPAQGGTTAGTGTGAPPAGVQGAAVQVDPDSGAVTLSIDPGKIPAGNEVFITTATGAVDSIGMAIATPGAVRSTCVLGVPPIGAGSTTAPGSTS